MNYQLENRGAVAAFRRMSIMVVRTGGRVGLSEEVYRLTLQYILMDGVEVRLVNGQDEGMDAIATIRSWMVLKYGAFTERTSVSMLSHPFAALRVSR